jgi:hypothetical protein
MTLADDLRAVAVDHAAIVITKILASSGGSSPERLARAVLEVATPYLLDAQRVDDALAARMSDVRAEQRVAPLPPLLWIRSGQDVVRFLELMEEHHWLTLTTIRADGETVTG